MTEMLIEIHDHGYHVIDIVCLEIIGYEHNWVEINEIFDEEKIDIHDYICGLEPGLYILGFHFESYLSAYEYNEYDVEMYPLYIRELEKEEKDFFYNNDSLTFAKVRKDEYEDFIKFKEKNKCEKINLLEI